MVPVTDLLIDTVALVRYLEDSLPAAADGVFKQAEGGSARLLLPQIALAEYIYIALRGRVRSLHSQADVEESVTNILTSDFIAVTTTPVPAWTEFLRLEISEMHDRLIASEAIARNVPLVSSDSVFKTVVGLKVIWK